MTKEELLKAKLEYTYKEYGGKAYNGEPLKKFLDSHHIDYTNQPLDIPTINKMLTKVGLREIGCVRLIIKSVLIDKIFESLKDCKSWIEKTFSNMDDIYYSDEQNTYIVYLSTKNADTTFHVHHCGEIIFLNK